MLRGCAKNHRRRGRTRGTTLMELLMALGLLTAAAGVFAQMHALAARQQRSADAREAASQALANWMERCSVATAADLKEERLLDLAQLEPLRLQLPGIEATAEVARLGSTPGG